MTARALRVDPRFNGPAGFANGGYAAGAVAVACEQPVAVRLARPVPLETELIVFPVDGGCELRDGALLIATASPRSLLAPAEPRSPPRRH